MTSQSGKQTIAIHILLDTSRMKENQTNETISSKIMQKMSQGN